MFQNVQMLFYMNRTYGYSEYAENKFRHLEQNLLLSLTVDCPRQNQKLLKIISYLCMTAISDHANYME
jgi:hypothetical protein